MIDKMVKIRKKHGFTQRDIAKKLKVPHCYVGRVETYERRLDIIETVKWLQVLELSDKEIIKILKKFL